MGWMVSATPRPPYSLERDPVPIAQEAEWVSGPLWTGADNLVFSGIRSPDSLARGKSLYLLRYTAHMTVKFYVRTQATVYDILEESYFNPEQEVLICHLGYIISCSILFSHAHRPALHPMGTLQYVGEFIKKGILI